MSKIGAQRTAVREWQLPKKVQIYFQINADASGCVLSKQKKVRNYQKFSEYRQLWIFRNTSDTRMTKAWSIRWTNRFPRVFIAVGQVYRTHPAPDNHRPIPHSLRADPFKVVVSRNRHSPGEYRTNPFDRNVFLFRLHHYSWRELNLTFSVQL